MSFAATVRPIIQNDCYSCHNGSFRDDLTQYNIIMQYVTAGNPSGSYLIQKITPPGSMAHYLQSSSDLPTITQWIQQGANP